MPLKNLAISILFMSFGCSSTVKQAVQPEQIISKPYLTLHNACEKSNEFSVCCEIEGFRKAMQESADLAKTASNLQTKLDAAEAHARIDVWFLESQINEKQREIIQLEHSKWVWASGGVGAGIVLTLLTLLLAN